MNKLVFLLITLLFSTLAFSQSHRSKAEAEVKKIYGPKYKNIKYTSAKEEWDGLKKYYTYYFDCDWKAPLNFKRNPSAKVEARISIDYWTNGEKRYASHVYHHRLKGMKHPDWSQIEKAFLKEYENGSIDPLEEFSSSLLNEVIEIKEVGLLKPEDKEFNKVRWGRFKYDDDYIGELYYNFETKSSMDFTENHIIVPIYMNVKKICSHDKLCESKIVKNYQFKRDDCNQPFYYVKKELVKGGPGPGGWASFNLSETKMDREEIKELKRSSIGGKMVEKRAKEEYDFLPKFDIPNDNFKDFALFVRKILIEGDLDKIKSLIINSYEKSRFEEGSDYMLNYSGEKILNGVLNAYNTDKKSNFQSVYCSSFTPTRLSEESMYYHFSSRYYDLSARTEIKGTKVGDKIYIQNIKIALPGDNHIKDDFNCPQDIILEELIAKDLDMKFKIPNGYVKEVNEVDNGDKSTIYYYHKNGQEYLVKVYEYNSLKGPLAKSQLTETVKMSANNFMKRHSYNYQKFNDWETNGITGVEARYDLSGRQSFAEKPSGGSTWYKGVMLNNKLYEFFIIGENWSQQDNDFMNSFEYTGGEVKTGIEAGDIKYKKGDLVEIYITGRWFKAEVKDVLEDGLYHVFAYDQNKNYKGSANNIRYDQNPPKQRLGGSSSSPANKGVSKLKVPKIKIR